MSTLDAITKRLNRMIEQVDARIKPEPEEPLFSNMLLFSADERDQVKKMLEHIEPLIDNTSPYPLNRLSDEELEQLEQWVTIYSERARAA